MIIKILKKQEKLLEKCLKTLFPSKYNTDTLLKVLKMHLPGHMICQVHLRHSQNGGDWKLAYFPTNSDEVWAILFPVIGLSFTLGLI